MRKLKRLIFLLSREDRFRGKLLLLMTLMMALIETAGVASILPFIALLTSPQIIETNVILKNIYLFLKSFGIENQQQFLTITGFFVFFLLITSISFKALTTFFILAFVRITASTRRSAARGRRAGGRPRQTDR